MLYPVKVIDIEISQPIPSLEGLEGYVRLQGLVRLKGSPIGYVYPPITNGQCSSETLTKIILKDYSWKIINCLLEQGLISDPNLLKDLNFEQLFNIYPPEDEDTNWPLVTVVVCTRDRASDLAFCLDALSRLDYPNLDILIVDNAPTNTATEELVKNKYPQFRYSCEPRPGLDWARNRGILEAKGEIIAYTDDDVVVDRLWVKALAKIFRDNPEVMALTGLVVPYELETEAQLLFEQYGGFGRGFERKWHRIYPNSRMPWPWLGTGQFGTGANMAYRRCIFDQIGLFDPALDVGTVTNGGGDLEMFFRVLKEGHTLVYEPNAMVRHRHRRDYAKLRTQLENNSIGFYSYCVRSLLNYPQEWKGFLRLALWWLFSWNLIRLWINFKIPGGFPRDLLLAEFGGCWPGLFRYQKARKNAEKIAAEFGEQKPETETTSENPPPEIPPSSSLIPERKMAVKSLDISQPLTPLTDVTDYSDVRLFVSWQEQLLTRVDIYNLFQPISVTRQVETIVKQLGLKLLLPLSRDSEDVLWAKAIAAITQHLSAPEKPPLDSLQKLPENLSVSIVLATYDRPEDLHKCLTCLTTQDSTRPVEIIVVDNHPDSGLTPPVVANFPDIKLIKETKQGLSYARNAGILASQGDIIVATDDDVTMPKDWLEKLISPFTRPDVMIVTGNVLPLELENNTQRFFETYGGLGRGFNSFEVNGAWFASFPRKPVPTWNLGATANAAFRASIFKDPEIGLIDEALGAGSPTGCSEDTYVFYKVLKEGYTLVYEASAYVWHKHRQDMKALRRQLYNYSKGHVAYHLTTWLNDGDIRGLVQIFAALPYIHLQRIYYWFRGWSNYPLSLIFVEIAGNLAGPYALWLSRQRVKRLGPSTLIHS